jgi:hypothetical protein
MQTETLSSAHSNESVPDDAKAVDHLGTKTHVEEELL